MSDFKKITLILADGTEYNGYSFGYEQSAAGELVFNTSMTGYVENLTDPSLQGKIVVQTYPLIGNYGVPRQEKDAHSLSLFYESDQIQLSGLIVSDYSVAYSHWNAETSLSDWLKQHKIPAIFGIDTRELTQIIREKGAMQAKIIIDSHNVEFKDYHTTNFAELLPASQPEIIGTGAKKITLVDCGVKNSIIRIVLDNGVSVERVPWNYPFSSVQSDGIIISNGAGNPEFYKNTIEELAKAVGQDKPILGIGLGNLLLARSQGMEVEKLPFGHHSQSTPIRMQGTNRCYISSQNHSYAVCAKSILTGWQEYFINVNDASCEGIKHSHKPIWGVQFIPETIETQFIITQFIDAL